MWNILDRLKEPSTYAGLSGLMIAIGLSTRTMVNDFYSFSWCSWCCSYDT